MDSPRTTCRMPFLARNELYKTEKPYGTDFLIDSIPGASVSNHIVSMETISVQDARNEAQTFSVDVNGFAFIKAQTSIGPVEKIKEQPSIVQPYIEQILNILKQQFPEYKELWWMDYELRKRADVFPYGHREAVEFAQPAAMPHTDFSTHGVYLRMTERFPEVEDWKNRDFDLINVWRVTRGPNDDWPLAVCDYQSVDWDSDTTTNDAVHVDRIGENWLLYPSSRQRWYYLSSMHEDDLIVLRNASSIGERSKCFHAAFNNPESDGKARESIELRFAAFRD